MGFDRNNHTKFTIGRLALAAGVGVTTIRYYQKRGLLRQPERSGPGGFRSYGECDLERLLLIKQAQELGFTLAEIADIISHLDAGDCRSIQTLIEKKLHAIKLQITLLNDTHSALSGLVSECSHDEYEPCPLIIRLCSRTPIIDNKL